MFNVLALGTEKVKSLVTMAAKIFVLMNLSDVFGPPFAL